MWEAPETVATVDFMVRETTKTVAGLTEQKKRLAVAIRRHMVAALNQRSYRVQNIVVIGPTGGGKTWMVRNMLASAGVPVVEINATMYSEVGYAGLDLSSFPAGFYTDPWLGKGEKRNLITPLAEHWGVVVIDEFDKIRFRKTPDGRDTGRALQAELLRITEGDTVYARSRDSEMGTPFNTHNLLFIGVGAFEGLGRLVDQQSTDPNSYTKAEPDHLQAYGFMEELIGRFSSTIILPPLKSDHMLRIIKEHIWPNWVQQAEDEGFELVGDEGALSIMANVAVERHVGARGLEPLIERALWRAWSTVQPGQRVVLDALGVTSGARVENTGMTGDVAVEAVP